MVSDDYIEFEIDQYTWYQVWGDGMVSFHYVENDYGVSLSRDEAIATARAILKHFGEGLE